MARIEELPDDFDESINLNETAPAKPAPSNDSVPAPMPDAPNFPINEERLKEMQKDPNAPQLPPAMAAVQSHTAEEILAMMNKTPLFMTDIDNAGDEGMLLLASSPHPRKSDKLTFSLIYRWRKRGA